MWALFVGHPMMHPGGPPHHGVMHPHLAPGPGMPMHMHHHPGHPGSGGPQPPHPMSHAGRYMRQGSAPAPPSHMSHSPHMHSPGTLIVVSLLCCMMLIE